MYSEAYQRDHIDLAKQAYLFLHCLVIVSLRSSCTPAVAPHASSSPTVPPRATRHRLLSRSARSRGCARRDNAQRLKTMTAGKEAALEKMLVRLEWGIPIEGGVQIRAPHAPRREARRVHWHLGEGAEVTGVRRKGRRRPHGIRLS
jgi:hypothetical protein